MASRRKSQATSSEASWFHQAGHSLSIKEPVSPRTRVQPKGGPESGEEELAQKFEEDLEDLFAKTDDAAQGDKGAEVEGPEAEECETEGAVPRKAFPGPGQPTQPQPEDHGIDHYPSRSWCPECAAGRATGEQHRARQRSGGASVQLPRPLHNEVPEGGTVV